MVIRRKKSKTVTKKKVVSKVSQIHKSQINPLQVENTLIVKCKESTFQQELKEAADPNYRLFWTLNHVKKVGDPFQARTIVFVTGKGIRGYFLIKGYGEEVYRGKVQPVVYFDRDFYSFE